MESVIGAELAKVEGGFVPVIAALALGVGVAALGTAVAYGISRMFN